MTSSLSSAPHVPPVGSADQGPPAAPRARAVRVLLAELNFDGTVGGSHQALFDVALSIDRTRFEPVVLFYQDNRYVELLRGEGVAVHVWESEWQELRAGYSSSSRLRQGRTMLRAIWRRWRFLRREHIGLLHLNNSPWIGVDDWLPAGRLARIPCIANGMGDVSGPAGLRRRVAASYDHVLPCSDMIAGGMRKLGYPDDRITTVHLGVDLQRFRARVKSPREEVRRALGVAPDEILALMIGNVRRWKGQHVVVDAVARMQPTLRERLRVVFAGAARPEDRDYLAAMEADIQRLGIARHVRFLGPRTDVPDLVNAADATIHASTTPEPFGIVLVEGMALGKVVLASDAGGPREIFAEGTGYLHDPQDPTHLARGLERLVDDPGWRAAVGARALARAETFDVSRMAGKIESVYARVLGA